MNGLQLVADLSDSQNRDHDSPVLEEMVVPIKSTRLDGDRKDARNMIRRNGWRILCWDPIDNVPSDLTSPVLAGDAMSLMKYAQDIIRRMIEMVGII